jgi:hypothetical protein
MDEIKNNKENIQSYIVHSFKPYHDEDGMKLRTHHISSQPQLSLLETTLIQTYRRSGRHTKHSKIMLKRCILSRHTRCCTAILQGIHLISQLISRPHGTLDTTIGEKSSQNHILDSILTK